MGKIGLYGIEVKAPIGVREVEQVVGRAIRVDIEVEYALAASSASDDLSLTVDYGVLGEAVHSAVAQPCKLLETAARAIAQKVLANYPDIKVIRIRLAKQRPFLPGHMAEAVVQWCYPEDY